MRFSFFFMAFVCAGSMSMAQFTATMQNVVNGKERIYQVYCDGEDYRYEFKEDGQDGVVIVKPWKNQTIIMIPEKKYWYQIACDDMITRMNDPVQAAYWYKKNGKMKVEGEEKIGGYLCEKQVLSQGDTRLYNVWFSQKLNFPVKIESLYSDNTYMNLKDINDKWRSHKSYFFVLPSYIEVDEQLRTIIPEPPAPESWSSRTEILPFDGTLKRGEKILIDIPSTGHYKIKVNNEGDTPTKYIYHLYESGKKLPPDRVGEDDRRTHRLHMNEKRTFTYAWEAGWQLIIEGYEGEVMMEVYLEKSTIN